MGSPNGKHRQQYALCDAGLVSIILSFYHLFIQTGFRWARVI